jgi:hypothetical protein
MSPPTEQLIRDFLNRLSVAARGKLAAEDRKALIERTHDSIERKVRTSDLVTSMEVAAMLSRFGDPATLVSQEVARLAAMRGEPPELPEEQQPRRLGFLRRRGGQDSWHSPRQADRPAPRMPPLNGTPDAAGGPAARTQAKGGTASSSTANGGTANGGTAEQQADEREPPIWVPRQAASPESVVDAPVVDAPVVDAPVVDAPVVDAPVVDAPVVDAPVVDAPVSDEPGSSAERPRWPSVVAMTSGGTAAAGAEPKQIAPPIAVEVAPSSSWQQPSDVHYVSPPRLIQAGRSLTEAAVRNAREHPLEAAAVVLLGLGGAAYPPVWVLGAGVAAASRIWDYRDKWVGLAGPVVLLVVGTVAGVSLGSKHLTFSSYWHEGWVYADILSRVGAALGAIFLAWRVGRGRREPPVPPWNRPHRVN